MLRISCNVLTVNTEFDVPFSGAEIVISGGMSVPQILTIVDARATPTSGIEKLCKTKSMV